MAYSIYDDLTAQIDPQDVIAITDDDESGGILEDFVSRAIADADSEINGYCGKRYSIPFSPVPVLVRKFSVDIAIYNLYSRRESIPDFRRERYNNAIAFLKGVAEGKNTLGELDPDSTPASGNTPVFGYSERLFTRTNMQDW